MSLKVGDKIKFELEKQDNRTSIAAAFLCINQNQKEVLKGNFSGVIL